MKLKIAYITVLFFSLAIPSAFADTVSTEIDDPVMILIITQIM
ncbi:MAG: hypothetical protein Ct9H300mP17_10720 [Candidatus Nitrosopelagicus sp.]|nr:MAG: hypothetical protein Ct9H300mP17_10720 [Candidatus Nitrosopelagicus sp.]